MVGGGGVEARAEDAGWGAPRAPCWRGNGEAQVLTAQVTHVSQGDPFLGGQRLASMVVPPISPAHSRHGEFRAFQREKRAGTRRFLVWTMSQLTPWGPPLAVLVLPSVSTLKLETPRLSCATSHQTLNSCPEDTWTTRVNATYRRNAKRW